MSEIRAIMPIMDFGGVRFIHSGVMVDFSELFNEGKVSFKQEVYRKKVAITQKRIQRHIGWDVGISTKLKNLTTTDYLLVEALLTLLNDANAYGDPIVIYPRFNASSVYLWGIACWLDTPIEFIDIDRICSGQEIELKWVSEELIPDLRIVYGQIAVDILLAEDGVDLITEDSNTIEREIT